MPFSNWYSPKVYRREVRFHDNVTGTDTAEFEIQGALDVIGAFALGGEQITPTGSEINSLVRFPGLLGHQTLAIGDAVTEGDTFTLTHDGSAETFEVKVLDQAVEDTADDADGALTAEADDVDLKMTTDGHGLVVGELILIGTEVMRVAAVNDEWVTVDRAQCGSTLAIHAQDQAVTNGLALADPGNIPIGFAAGALTNAVSSVRIPATFNAETAYPIEATRLADEYVLFRTTSPAAFPVTLAETFTEAGIIWLGDWVDGAPAGLKQAVCVAHTVTSDEQAADQIVIPLAIEPSAVTVQLRDAGGEIKTFDGDVTIATSPDRVVIENPAAGVDFADTDILTILAYE